MGGYCVVVQGISIHAPREGSDRDSALEAIKAEISIHAPREGSDTQGEKSSKMQKSFQSTLPVKGATVM